MLLLYQMIGLRPSLSVVGDGKCIKESKRGVGGESIEANLIILCHLLKMTGLKIPSFWAQVSHHFSGCHLALSKGEVLLACLTHPMNIHGPQHTGQEWLPK